uniref:BTB domain-containing protein n=1 Tax=Parascaris univalens TaxID=6257 RepID=A0A915A9P9_PARUN
MTSPYDAFPSAPAPLSRMNAANLMGIDGYAPEMHHSNEVVQLNVGGTIYSTLYDTLVNSKSKFFEHMFRVDPHSGRVAVFKQNIIMKKDEYSLIVMVIYSDMCYNICVMGNVP